MQTQLQNPRNPLGSTGPTSVEGKAISSQNARKSGIWSQPFNLLPGESVAELDSLIADYHHEFNPQGAYEVGLVSLAIKSIWLVSRYDRVEPVLVERYIHESGKSPDEAYADMLLLPKNNILKYLNQRRNQAQNHWFKAIKELQRVQKLRAKQAKPTDLPAVSHETDFVPQPTSELNGKLASTPSISPGKAL